MSGSAAVPQKRKRRLLQQASNGTLFRTLIDTAADGVLVTDDKGRIEICNAACERLFRYAAKEIIGKDIGLLMPASGPQTRGAAPASSLCTVERCAAGTAEEATGRRKDGSTFPVYISAGEARIGSRRIFVGIMRDLSAERRMETARDHLASIVESSADAIIAKKLDGTVTAWNKTAERMFGYTAAQMIGDRISKICPPDLLAEEAEIMDRVRRGGRIETYETRRRRRDGTEITVSLTASPIRNSSGEIIGVSKIARDITERKAAEARFSTLQSELIHLSRWNTMGMMASSIAHELNQPLAAMTNYLGALKRVANAKPRNEKLLNELVDKAGQQGQRAATIIQHVRDLVAKGKSERRPENLAGVVREALQIASVATRRSRIDLRFEAQSPLPLLEIDRVQIQQVIINLVRNAAEAMAEEPVRKLDVTVRRDGELARVDVADTGPGLPPEVEEHLFEAFVSTKSSGMGLGLSICEQIVTGHGGRLWASSNKPNGTVFSFTLPLVCLSDR